MAGLEGKSVKTLSRWEVARKFPKTFHDKFGVRLYYVDELLACPDISARTYNHLLALAEEVAA